MILTKMYIKITWFLEEVVQLFDSQSTTGDNTLLPMD